MSISRRQFLGWLGAAGVTSGLAATAGAATNADFSGYPDSRGILFDNVLCVGCRRCEAGCSQVNDLPPPQRSFDDLSVLDRKRRTDAAAFTVVNRYDRAERPGSPVYRVGLSMVIFESTLPRILPESARPELLQSGDCEH